MNAYQSAVVLFGFLAAGCGSDSGSGASAPVASTPMTGTINGVAFVPKIALAEPGISDPNKRSLRIVDADTDCNGGFAKRSIIFSVPWTEGLTKDLSFGSNGQTVTFSYEESGGYENYIATTGRLELVSAPTEAGAKGKLRLRANFDDKNKIDGEVPVLICK
jgi:hypothetical protein